MGDLRPILVTGAAGGVGAVGRAVVELLRQDSLPVRALVHREDSRAERLRATGAEVVVGDLTRAPDVLRAVDGCRRMYFGMSVSAQYLEGALTTAAVARHYGGLDAFVNISQMTVSQMTFSSTAESTQQRHHWLTEQALNWSGLPVIHLRPTAFLENPLFTVFMFASIQKDGTIRLPFGSARTSPIAAHDVAEAAASLLRSPEGHIGKTYELTGPQSRDLATMAGELTQLLDRPVTYLDIPLGQWIDQYLRPQNLPPHLFDHLATMARLHAENRYDRQTGDYTLLTGKPASDFRAFLNLHPEFRERD
ncbi:NAD(P)H-binding protein [Acrocarpospora catenulata]|uniref:NAD(P)H-binding protein n=1 Tax=Acrocarpospora catenulata TaxID=2836182 RepID=UPI001BDA239C|nr:NAD(P)H-binding protein [Acrocarpospora catenulata]